MTVTLDSAMGYATLTQACHKAMMEARTMHASFSSPFLPVQVQHMELELSYVLCQDLHSDIPDRFEIKVFSKKQSTRLYQYTIIALDVPDIRMKLLQHCSVDCALSWYH
jgi:hypothetical protein